MKVTYRWSRETDNPEEIIDITVDCENIDQLPRVLDTVDICVDIEGEQIRKLRKVESVCFSIRNTDSFVVVHLMPSSNK